MASLLVVVPVPLGDLGVSEAQAQYRESSRNAFLHRTEIVEGQTRTFEISSVGADTYYLHVKPLAAPYTAEADDLSVTILDGTDVGAPLAVGGFGAVQRDLQQRIRFDVAALAPGSDDEGDETFGVQLCTTADCTGGTILGDWTITMTDAPADTTVSGGSGVTVTIPGTSGDGVVSVMEVSPNGDNRDQLGEFILTLTSAPSQDIVIVAKSDSTASTNSATNEMGPIARSNAASSLDYHNAESASYNPAEAYYEVARFAPGDTGDDLTKTVTVASVDNDEDTDGLSITGNLEFRVLQDDAAYRDSTVGNAAVYSGIAIPNVPIELTGDDEHTVITLGDAATADNIATEASATDTAKFRVTLERGLGTGETLTVPIAFAGATLGTHFTLALDGSPSGVAYADATDGSGRGMLTFTGPSDAEATLVVTAVGNDGDTIQNRLRLWIYKDDQTWRRTRFDTNMVGGVCAGDGCIGGFLRDRQHNITLNEASPGIGVIDNNDGTVRNRTNYQFQVRLNTQPSGDVTVTATAPSIPGASLTWPGGNSRTFSMSNWDQPQTFTLWYSDQRDTPTASHSVTLAITSASDSTYNGLSDVTHDLIFRDNVRTSVKMDGDGVRASSSSGNEISSIMVEGDATRVDATLTVSLGRALVDGEYLRVPLLLVAQGHDTSTDGDGCLDADGNLSLDDCDVVETVRGPRYSAHVAWPTHYNDFDMAATGTGVSIRAVNRRTPAHTGYRYLEFRGAGAQDATIRLNARDGFNDGEGFDERFYIIFNHVIIGANPAPVDTNLDGGVDLSNQQAWFQIADDDDFTGAGTAVPDSWSLLPAGLEPGDKFRLIYVTSQETAASSSDLSTYDTFVRAEITGNDLVNGGIADLTAHATSFKAIGEAGGTSARDHASFNPHDAEDPNLPIYWVGGSKVADDNADFTDYTWDDEANPRYADGNLAMYDSNNDGTKDTAGPDPDGYWTGTDRTGAQSTGYGACGSGSGYPANPRLGASRVSVGYLDEAGSSDGSGPRTFDANTLGPTTFSGGPPGQGYCHSFPNSETRPMYALSGVFTVVPTDGVTLTGSSAAEGSAVTFTVTLPEAAPAGGITVPYTLSDGRGISSDPAYIVATSADYTNTGGSVTVPQGDTAAMFTVATTDDTTYESDHYFTVTLGTPTGGTNPPPLHSRKSIAVGAIDDDADAPTVVFSAATASVAEDAGTVDVTVTKSGTTLVPASVYWTTADDTASHPGDYTAQSGYLEFATSDTTKTITVPIVDDTTAENTETFKVQLDDALAVAAQVGSTAETTITLTDDDGGTTTPELTFAQATYSGAEGGGTINVTVNASVAPSSPLTVNLTTTDGTATGGADYTTPTATFTFPASVTSHTISVAIADDNTSEPHEQFTLMLTSGTGYTVGTPASASVTIINDDGAVTIAALGESGGDANGNIVENASDGTEFMDVTITLGRVLTGSETVTAPLLINGATVADDYTFTLEPSTQTGVTLDTSDPYSAQNPAVQFSAGAYQATLRLTAVDNDDRTQPFVFLRFNNSSGNRPTAGGGLTLGTVQHTPTVQLVIVDDETGDIEVSADWALAPSAGFASGDFRLFFLTSAKRNAASSDIGVYDDFIRRAMARGGHEALLPYAGLFHVFGSTRDLGARDHNGMRESNAWTDGSTSASSAGTPIYWVNGSKIADNYFDFCDGSWDNRWTSSANHLKNEMGQEVTQHSSNSFVFTGTRTSCAAHTHVAFASGTGVMRGRGTAAGNGLETEIDSNSDTWPFYAMSPVFTVEGPPALTFAQATHSVAENGGTVTVTVNASSAPDAALTVNLNSQGVGATAGSDYTAPGTTFTFPANMTTHTFTVAISDDSILEADEDFTLTLAAADDSSYTVGTQDSTTVTITDNDTATVEIAAANYTVLEDAGTASITVEVTGSSTTVEVPLTVTLTPANATAMGASGGTGADFDSDAVTVTGTKGSSTVTVPIPITDDGGMEVDETFTVTLSTTQARVSVGTRATATVTIADDDNAKGLVFTPATLALDENGSATYTVHPTELPTNTVTVTVTVPGSTDLTVDTNPSMAGTQTSALTFTTSNWYIGQAVEVSAADDADAVDDTVMLSHAPTGGGYSASHDAQLSVTVDDDDTAVPELTFGSATYSVTEGDHPETVTVTVTVNADSAPTSDLTVSLASANGTAVVTDDYTAPASTFTFTSGSSSETIDVSIVSNDFLEGSETFTLTLQDGTGYTVGTPATTTVTITDDDSVGVRLSSATYTVAEGDGTVTVGVRVIGESNIPIRVTLTPSDGTATGGSDPTAAGVDFDSDAIMSITIPALDRSISRTIAINDDNIFEQSETFTVTLSVVAGQRGVTTGIPNVGTITITDNDPAPVTVAMSASDGDSGGNAVEGASNATGYRTITLTLGRALTGTETVTVPLSVVGATVGSSNDYTFGLQPTSQTGVSLTTTGGTHTAQNPAVEFTSGASSATLRLTPVDNNARTQPYVVIDYGTGSQAPGSGRWCHAGCSFWRADRVRAGG